jgi:DNA-binding transcriptional ArsR family regulator
VLYDLSVKTFEALAAPSRRRILELLADGEHTAGELGERLAAEAGLSQPATSRHLRVLREAELVRSRVDGASRVYSLEPRGFGEVADWIEQFRGLWSSALDRLEGELTRGDQR